jgi:hypothetical protein
MAKDNRRRRDHPLGYAVVSVSGDRVEIVSPIFLLRRSAVRLRDRMARLTGRGFCSVEVRVREVKRP